MRRHPRRRISHDVTSDAEIASQPECWREGRRAGRRRRRLPRPGERVAVVGCGTSWFMAMAYAALREQAGQGETDAFQASEFPARPPRTTGSSRSPAPAPPPRSSTCSARCAARTPTTVIIGDPGAARRRAGHRRHRAGLRRRAVGGADPLRHQRARPAAGPPRRGHRPDRRRRRGGRAAAAAGRPGHVEQITFLGRGWTIGLAEEAALKCREAATFWAEAYPAMDYRHGPISIAAPGRVVWAFGEIPARPGRGRRGHRRRLRAQPAPRRARRAGPLVRRALPARPDGRPDRRPALRGARSPPAGASTRTAPRNLTRSVVPAHDPVTARPATTSSSPSTSAAPA